MAVVFWKTHHREFNGLVGKTTLDLAIEKYAATGSPVDLEKLQLLLAVRRKLQPSEMKPRDVVVERVAADGNAHDFRMLQALVKAKAKRFRM